jgi:hydrogenase maturation protein HypF
MKLEAFAAKGRTRDLNLPIKIEEKNGLYELKTTQMVKRILDLIDEIPRYDLAYSFQEILSQGLAEMAFRTANSEGINTIAFSGGVANNHMITKTIREKIEANGLRFIRHKRVPAGDGGISLGQAVIASFIESK